MTSACPACAAVPMAEQVAAGPALQFSLPTIHCAACIGKIERGLETLTGVGHVRVNLSLKRLSVQGQVDPANVTARLAELGFDAYPLDIDALNTARDDAGRALLVRMAVAGFAMMNVMLLSVAVWSGATDTTRDLFHLISAMIALPVVAYSGQPFFQNAWTALRVKRLNMDVPISLAIILAAGMSLLETLNGAAHADYDAALSLTIFPLISGFLGHITSSAARSAAKELTALEVQTAERLTETGTETVNAASLRVGDIVLVPTGGRVPVDAVLTSSDALLDRSLLTGESAAVSLNSGDILQAGEINIGSAMQVRAVAVGEDTSLRRMAALIETAENGRNSYTALADRAAQIYAPAVHLLALVAFLGWVALTGDMRFALNVAVAVLIITCPCALGLAVPAVSTAAISRLFSAGFLVRHATALERLSEVDHIVFDKTGTLTIPAVDLPNTLSTQDKSIAKALAQASHHPLSKALVRSLPDIAAAPLDDIHEVAGRGIQGTTDGQIVRLGKGTWLGASFVGLGLRIGDAPACEINATETLRPGAREAVTTLAALGYGLQIMSGDRSQAVERVVAECL